jgi:hypothetical protein
MDARFTTGVAEDVAVLAVDDAGLAGGAIEVLVAEAADGRVVVRALDAVAVVPPRDARGFVGLVTLLLDAASDARGLLASTDEVDAVLIRLFKPLALEAAVELVVGRVAVEGVGRVGGLLRLLFNAVEGDDVFVAVADVDVRAELVVVGFLIGGAVVREAGLLFSIALMRDTTEDVLVVFGDAFSVPEDSPSRSETRASRSDAGASEPERTSSAAAGGAVTISGSLLSAMLSIVKWISSECYSVSISSTPHNGCRCKGSAV